MMFSSLQRRYNQRRLRNKAYTFLFDPPSGREVICFDCETSGLNPKTAEILSIAAIKIKDNVILTSQKLEIFIHPSRAIEVESIKIHHLRHCDLERGLTIEEALPTFLYFIRSCPLIGYYVEFDIAMINKYLKPFLGIKLPNQHLEVSGIYYDMKQNPFQPAYIDLRFDAILTDLDLPRLDQHDAFNDALMTAMIYVKLQKMSKKKNW